MKNAGGNEVAAINDQNSVDNSIQLNQSQMKSIEKRISAYHNGNLMSQCLEKTFMESNVDVMEYMDNFSKLSQSQIYGNMGN